MAGSRLGGYRAAMWLLFAAGVLNLWSAVRNLRSGNSSSGALGLVIFFGCLAAGAWFGWRRASILAAERDRQSRSDAILLLVAELGKQGDEALERIAKQGGPAGEAAVMVLEGRRGRMKSS